MSYKLFFRPAFCTICNKNVKAETHIKDVTGTLGGHILLSLLTVGLWIPIWIVLALNFENGGGLSEYTCSTCGNRKLKKPIKNQLNKYTADNIPARKMFT